MSSRQTARRGYHGAEREKSLINPPVSGHAPVMRFALTCVALAACHGSQHAAPDADIHVMPDATADATPDARPDATPDAGAPIHVHAQLIGAPLAGLPVLFHDPSGALIGRALTDAAGDAIGDVPDGSMVTVVFPATSRDNTLLNTVVAAARGDKLVFGSPTLPPQSTWTATVPPYTGTVTALDYNVALPCLVGDSQTTSVGLQTACVPPAHGPAMAVAADVGTPEGFVPRAYIEQVDVALPAGANIAFTGAWLPAVNQTFAVTGVPNGAEIGIGKTWYRGGLPYFGFARMIPNLTSGTLPGPGGGDAWRAETIVCLDPQIQQCQIRFRDATDPLQLGDDFAAHRTAWLGRPTLTLGARTTSAWTADIAPDATILQTRIIGLDVNSFPQAEWDVVQPAVAATSGTVTLPELPADLAPLWVGLSTDGYSETELDRMETLSYAAVRARWFSTPPVGELEVAQRSFSQLP
jgi:hypothetical protein